MNLSDLELLLLEIGTIWPLDEKGSIRAEHLLVIAESPDGRRGVNVNGRVPADLSVLLHAAVSSPAGIGESLESCRNLLREQFGDLAVSSGPSFLVSSAPESTSHLFVVRQKTADETLVRSAERPATWEAGEWAELLDGKHGPWAMTLDDGRITSICHCARLTAFATEAGVWTHPEFRGQGRAAAVTAAWAAEMLPTGRQVFYSTSSDNRSSQRVAARLGLRPIGTLWKHTPADHS